VTPPPHRATTANLRAAYPFVAAAGLGSSGTYLGRDVHGGAFCFDPWELYRAGLLTSPNVIVVGQIGRGKSTFVKTFVWRQLVFGRQAWIIDPKGEYETLARACGSEPLRVAPGGSIRLNPLDTGPAAPGDLDPVRRRAELLCSVTEASLGRGLSPAERTSTELATRLASRRRASPTLPDVVTSLLDPDPDLAATVRTDAAGLAADGRTVALELRRLVEGDLAGMFDGPTTAGIDLDGPIVVLDLSALYDSPALGLLMTCATAWLQACLRRSDGIKRLVVVDEAWAILHDLATARWLQASFKLSRSIVPTASGRGPPRRLRNPGDLRPTPVRGRLGPAPVGPDEHGGRAVGASASRRGALEGRGPILPCRAHPRTPRGDARRHRRRHARRQPHGPRLR
jgi:hypothetical protein